MGDEISFAGGMKKGDGFKSSSSDGFLGTSRCDHAPPVHVRIMGAIMSVLSACAVMRLTDSNSMRSVRSTSRSYLAGRFGQPPLDFLVTQDNVITPSNESAIRSIYCTFSHSHLLKQSWEFSDLPSTLILENTSAHQLSINQRQYCSSWLKLAYTFRGFLPLPLHLRKQLCVTYH